MKRFRPLCSITVLIVLVFIDQITKYACSLTLKGTPGINIIGDAFSLYYVENRGISFSLLSGKMSFITILTGVLILIIIYILFKIPKEKYYHPFYFAILTLLAGAIGNFIDRVVNGYVIDFINVAIISFPVFNVADIYVTVSLIFMVFLIIFKYKDKDFDFLRIKASKKDESDN